MIIGNVELMRPVFRIKTSRCLKFDFLSFKTNDGFYAN